MEKSTNFLESKVAQFGLAKSRAKAEAIEGEGKGNTDRNFARETYVGNASGRKKFLREEKMMSEVILQCCGRE